jgi:hypothetical protein
MPARPVLPILGAVLAVVAAGVTVSSSAAPSLARRTFRLSYTARVKEARAGAIDVWVPVPASDPNQTVHQIRVKAPGAVTISTLPRGAGSVLHYRGEGSGTPIEI